MHISSTPKFKRGLIVTSLIICALVYLAIPRQDNELIDGLKLNSPNQELNTNGMWKLVKIFGQHKDEVIHLKNSLIEINDNIIKVGHRFCEKLSTEIDTAETFINEFNLHSSLNGSEKTKVWLTNCNNAGNLFVRSNGLQSFVIIDEKFFFVLHRSSGGLSLIQLVKEK